MIALRTILTVWLIVMSILSCLGQERIRLTTGKVIKDARIYQEYPKHITYERKMSLHDLEKARIEEVETDSSIIKFDAKGTRVEYMRNAPQVGIVKGGDQNDNRSEARPSGDPSQEEASPQEDEPVQYRQASLDDEDDFALPPIGTIAGYAGGTIVAILLIVMIVAF